MYSYNTLILHYCEMSIFFDIFIKKISKKILTRKKICVIMKSEKKFLMRVEV